MAGHKELEDKSSQEDCAETRGTIWNWWSTGTSDLSTESWRIHNVFHATLLQPYIENKVYENNYQRPLPKLLEGKKVYEVKTILKHQRRGRSY
jgi:hypothetical protein